MQIGWLELFMKVDGDVHLLLLLQLLHVVVFSLLLYLVVQIRLIHILGFPPQLNSIQIISLLLLQAVRVFDSLLVLALGLMLLVGVEILILKLIRYIFLPLLNSIEPSVIFQCLGTFN